MFNIKRKFEIEAHEVMNFVRLLGRFGMRFRMSDEYIVEDPEAKTKRRVRRFVVYGSYRQLNEFLEAIDIIHDYTNT